jgi:hypothetical protein
MFNCFIQHFKINLILKIFRKKFLTVLHRSSNSAAAADTRQHKLLFLFSFQAGFVSEHLATRLTQPFNAENATKSGKITDSDPKCNMQF